MTGEVSYLHQWASYYGQLGLRVLPLSPKTKDQPLLKKWPERATVDVQAIDQWWAKNPQANIAVAMGCGLVDLETDVKQDAAGNPLNGEDSLTAWCAQNGVALPKTWMFRSGGGGIHRLFNLATPISNSTNILPAVDVRGDGGYAVFPPSTHPNGNGYAWIEGHSPADIPTGAAVLPFELFSLLAKRVGAYKPPLDMPESIPEGQRNDTLFRIACKYRESGMVYDELLPTLQAINDTRCNPPIADAELVIICEQAAKYQPGVGLNREITGSATPSRYAPKLVKAADIPYEPPRWLILPYFQRGKGTLIQADGGTGKTALMCSIAAHVSTGNPIMDIGIDTPGDVLILSVEDDLAILRGRIEANGGDLSRCHFITNAAGLTFNSPEVEQAIIATRAKLIVFDPFQAFIGAKVNMDKSNQTRPELAALFEMADRNDCAVAIVAHIGKDGFGKSAVNRSLGSVDIGAAMRSIIHVIENPDNTLERVGVHVKCSNSPKGRSFVYTIGDRGAVQWVGYSQITADDLKASIERKEKGVPYELEPLAQVFRQLIMDKPGGGFFSYADLKEEGAKILGFPPFGSTDDLKQHLNGSFARELQTRDGLIVTCGQKQGGVRGVKIERYIVPTECQTALPFGGGVTL